MKINYTNINPGTFGNYTSCMRRFAGIQYMGRLRVFCVMKQIDAATF